ncbi:MAG TPA: NBR1-Ig-like domain-containing protein [Anaerolineales bacterium]
MKKSLVAFVLLALLVTACNLPGNGSTATQESPDAIFTQAAQTVAAELTRVALLASPTSSVPIVPTSTFTPFPTNTPLPTNTAVNTPTKTPIPCNLATWDPATIDQSVPDNTKMAPNQVFSKTWRIRNVGTCSWNSSYLLIFDHGDGLGVTTGYTQQLTTGVVDPGQEVDLIVNNLKAPAVPGMYTSYWRLRDPGGVVFGITPSESTFVVKIVVVATTTRTLLPVFGESGSVRLDGITSTSELSVGDSSLDKSIEMFLSYNISGIPSNATITEVKLDMRNSTMAGNPFALGVLNLYPQDFGTLDGSDYVPTMPNGGNLADWGAAAVLNTVEVSPEIKNALQSKLGASRFQFRLQFPIQTNSNGADDKLMYGPVPITDPINNPVLIVTYMTP